MNDWKLTRLSDVADIIGGGTPKSSEDTYFNGDISWITPKDLSGYNYRYISKGERNITELGLKNSSAKLLPKGSVLFTSRAPIG
ncbi:restriction endonuclease subunit S, partial [Actinobacillus suis]